MRPTTKPHVAPIAIAISFWRVVEVQRRVVGVPRMNVLIAKPMPPAISAPPTTRLIVDCVASENELAIWTPTSDSGAEPTSIQSASGTCTLPSCRWRTAPNDLKTAPWRMSVPTAVFGSKPKSRISIGVIRLPPPMPVMPTRTPTSRPAIDELPGHVRAPGIGQETNGRPREQAGELVRLAAGAEAGHRGEQRERGDEQRRARRRRSPSPARVGDRRGGEHDEADDVRGARRARVLERAFAEARLDQLEVRDARQAVAAAEA